MKTLGSEYQNPGGRVVAGSSHSGDTWIRQGLSSIGLSDDQVENIKLAISYSSWGAGGWKAIFNPKNIEKESFFIDAGVHILEASENVRETNEEYNEP